MLIWKIIKCVCIFGAVPFFIGFNFLQFFQEKAFLKERYVYGWLFMLALFEMIAIPAVFLNSSLTILTLVYTISIIIFFVISSCIIIKNHKYFKMNWRREKKGMNLYIVFGIILMFVQITVAIFYVHMDSDDAYYIGTATSSITTDTLFWVEPDTGYPNDGLPMRYVFAAITLFWAYLSKLTGIHPLIIAHTIIPGIFILISYILWWEIGKVLFKEKEKQGFFFLLINVINIFGNTSVYTQSTFLLFRIWQGKAMLPNIILPAIILTFYEIYKYPKEKRQWFIIFIIICAACCCSSMAVPMGILSVAAGTCVISLLCKEWKMILYGIMCCIPCLMIGVAYLVL